MPLHGVGTEKEHGSDLRIREPVTGEPGDLRLLGGEVGLLLRLALASRFTGGLELAASPLGEGPGPDAAEDLVSCPQLPSGVHATVFTSQPFAVDQVSARERA